MTKVSGHSLRKTLGAGILAAGLTFPLLMIGAVYGAFPAHAPRLFIPISMALVGLVVSLLHLNAFKETLSPTESRKIGEADETVKILFNALPMGCILFGTDRRIVDCNQALLDLFGFDDKWEFLGTYHRLQPERQPCGRLSDELRREMLNKVPEGGLLRFEWTYVPREGETLPVEIILVPVTLLGKEMLAAYVRDLREQKAHFSSLEFAREELRLAMEAAQAANVSKSIFLASISHEIRTPMNAIIGIAEMHLQQAAPPAETEEAFGKIYDSGQLMLSIINDVLDISKVEAGKLEILPVKYDLTSLISDAIHLNHFRLGGAKVEFRLEVDPATPLFLFGDASRITQILNNMLSNAFKYTDEGSVKLRIGTCPGRWIGDGADPSGTVGGDGDAAPNGRDGARDTVLTFQVTDTGMGMSPSQIARIFDPYSRFHTNRAIMGVGLGMNITRSLVAMMGGEITVESELGKGSAFTVRLPQKAIGDAVCGPEIVERLAAFRLQGRHKAKKAQFVREHMPYGKVLVVDDMETNLYVAKGLLKPYGLRVETANSGQGAIDRVRQGNEYDIIFMDYLMPDLNGLETARTLRGMGYSRAIVALTANALIGEAERFLESGFDGFIPKPIDSRELNAVLNDLIRDRQPAEVLAAARSAREGDPANGLTDTAVSDQMAKAFIWDAERGLEILEKYPTALESSEDTDMGSYVVTVHGLKTSLANIGQTALSALAAKLEKACRDGDSAVISAETPAFLYSLRSVIDGLKPETASEAGLIVDEDRDLLNGKLAIIEKACQSSYDKRTIKSALDELMARAWSRPTTEILEDVRRRLLHSDFNGIVRTIRSLYGS